MLVLTRRLNETIRIGDDIEITVTSLSEHRVKIGISAPRDIQVIRGEVLERDQRDSDAA
jgi:carbon storage regulator